MKHRIAIINGVFPRFRSTPYHYRTSTFRSRAKYIAGLVKDSGADCATFNELGRPECAVLAEYLPWQYDRAQGRPGQDGLNSVWSDSDVWAQPETGLGDYNMPSGGQWVRTLLLAQLTEKTGSKTSLTVGSFHETLTNEPGLAYVKAMVSHVPDGTALLGGDFKRTGDRDDLAYMAAKGFRVHERTSGTPMACFTRGQVVVTNVDHVSRPRAFDHEYLVVDFTTATVATPARKKA